MRMPFALALGAFLILPVASTAEPTVQQTVDYINNTYKSCVPIVTTTRERTYSLTTVYKAAFVSVEKGRLTTTGSIRQVGNRHGTDEYFRKVCRGAFDNLPKEALQYGRIDPSVGRCPYSTSKFAYEATAAVSDLATEVALEDTWLVIECHSAKKCIQSSKTGRRIAWVGERKKINEKKAQPKNYLPTCDNKRDKLRRAFSHLIKLQGGKKELF